MCNSDTVLLRQIIHDVACQHKFSERRLFKAEKKTPFYVYPFTRTEQLA